MLSRNALHQQRLGALEAGAMRARSPLFLQSKACGVSALTEEEQP